MAYFKILLHDFFTTIGTSMELVHAFLIRMEVLLQRLPVAFRVRAIHGSIAAVLVDVSLNMAPRHSLVAAFGGEGTLDFDFVAHVDQ